MMIYDLVTLDRDGWTGGIHITRQKIEIVFGKIGTATIIREKQGWYAI